MKVEIFSYITDSRYYAPLFVALGTYFFIWIVKNIVLARLKRISVTTETYLDDVVLLSLEKTKLFFMVGTAIYAGLITSPYADGEYGSIGDKIFLVVLAFQVMIWGTKAISSWFDFALKKKNDDPAVKTSFGFLGLLLKVAFVLSVGLFVLNNLGINVSTFVAGLGVGGIAIALATQNILGDLFSSLSIVLDRPFIVGDFINLGEWMGTVEHVGLKTTRIRSLTGEQIIVSNSDLLSSKIRNFKRMVERRVVFQLGVTYQTKREKLMLLAGLIEEIIKKEGKTRFERAHFIRYGASSLDFEAVYWVTSPEYKDFADIHQRVLFGIHEAFEEAAVDFAYPTQTLFIESINTR